MQEEDRAWGTEVPREEESKQTNQPAKVDDISAFIFIE